MSKMMTSWPPRRALGQHRADPAAADDHDLHGSTPRWSDRLAHHPHGAGRVLEDVRDRAPDREVAAEPLPVGQAEDQQVGAALARPRRRSRRRRRGPGAGPSRGLPCSCLGDRLGAVEDALGLLGLRRPCRRRAAGSSRPRRRGRRPARRWPAGRALRRGGRFGSSQLPPASARIARLKAPACGSDTSVGLPRESWISSWNGDLPRRPRYHPRGLQPDARRARRDAGSPAARIASCTAAMS